MTTPNIHFYEVVFSKDGIMFLIDCQTMERVQHPEFVFKSDTEVRVFEKETEVKGVRGFTKIIGRSIYLENIDPELDNEY